MNMPPSTSGNNRRPNRKKSESSVIELVRADLVDRSRSGLGRFVVALVLVLLAILFLAGLARIGGLFWLRSEISASTGEIATVSGFDERTTDWLTGTVSFVSTLLVAGSVLQLLLALVFPGIKGPKLVRSALLVLGATGFFAVAPGIVGGMRGVDGKGLPAEMEEVDPATVRWFHPDGRALIYFADHLDGERRFWNRPGHTPADGAVALPVSQEIYLSWMERKKRQAEAKQHEDRIRETELARESARKSEDSMSEIQEEIDRLNRDIEFYRDVTKSIREIKEGASKDTPASTPPSAPQVPVYVPTPEPIKVPEAADFEFVLLPGRILQLTLDGRAAEVWSDGSVELTRPRFNGVVLLGSQTRRSVNDIDVLQVRASSRQASRLHLRWLDPAQNQQIPAIAYAGLDNGAPVSTPATRPVSYGIATTGSASTAPNVPTPSAPRPPQQFPLSVGRTFTINVEGDTVECWGNGPIFVAVDRAEGGVRELQAYQRIRISGSRHVIAGASAAETTTLFVQAIAPNPAKAAGHVASEAARAGQLMRR